MNVDWASGGRRPSYEANWLGLWVHQKLAKPSTSNVAIVTCISTQPDTHFTHEGCSSGAQTVPKAVYQSSCRNKHDHTWWDSNLGPLTPQSDVLTNRPLRDNRTSIFINEVKRSDYTLGLHEQTAAERNKVVWQQTHCLSSSDSCSNVTCFSLLKPWTSTHTHTYIYMHT